MGQFLKVFLTGILYVLLSPLIVAFLAVYAVYCIFVFIYMGIRCIIVFFAGGYPLGDLKEDVEAKRILKEREEKKNAPAPQAVYVAPATPFFQTGYVAKEEQLASNDELASQDNIDPLYSDDDLKDGGNL